MDWWDEMNDHVCDAYSPPGEYPHGITRLHCIRDAGHEGPHRGAWEKEWDAE
jgi:hypothetical protein